MSYIWQSNAWPNFVWQEDALTQKIARIAEKAGMLKGVQIVFSKEEHAKIQISELGAEAVYSFAIEGEDVDIEEITASVAMSMHHTDAKIAGDKYRHVAQMIVDAKQVTTPLDQKRLCYWHQLLFDKAVGYKQIGSWRQTEMKIVSGYLHDLKVEYEAPPPEQVEDEMAKLVTWLNNPANEQVSAPIKAAVAHLWFESIHPFEDGNGRIGRAICDYVLNCSEIYKDVPFSLSRVLLKRRKEYYAQLNTIQRMAEADKNIEVTAFVEWFLSIISDALDYAQEQALFIIKKKRFFEQNKALLNNRQSAVLHKLFEAGEKRVLEGVSAKPYAKIAKTSSATATRDLADLAAKGVIARTKEGGRNIKYLINY